MFEPVHMKLFRRWPLPSVMLQVHVAHKLPAAQLDQKQAVICLRIIPGAQINSADGTSEAHLIRVHNALDRAPGPTIDTCCRTKMIAVSSATVCQLVCGEWIPLSCPDQCQSAARQ